MESLTFKDFDALNRMIYNYRRYLLTGVHSEYQHRRRGSSFDFYDFKEYLPGDDPRYINWNSFLRHEKLYTKTFHEEAFFYIHILIDNSQSMTLLPDKANNTILFACAMTYIALALRLPVEVELLCNRPQLKNHLSVSNIFALEEYLKNALVNKIESIQKPKIRQSRRHREIRLSEYEADVQNMKNSVNTYVDKNIKKNGIVFLLSDFLFDPGILDTLLKILIYANFEVRPVQVIAEKEKNPRIDQKSPLILIDCETGEDYLIKFDPDDYKKSYNIHLATLNRILEKNKVPILRLTSSPDETVIMFIRKNMLKLGIVR